MHSIELLDVSFAHGDVAILSRAHASFGAGFTALVGANGVGKSTLLRLLAGALVPDTGAIRMSPRAAHVVLVAQADERDDDDDPRSPGEARMVTLERALAQRPDVLLLDEPTNHLDARARSRLVHLLRGFRGVGVVVSHDRAFLDEIAARTASLRDGVVRIDEAPYSRAAATWAMERDAALHAREVARDHVHRHTRELARRRDNERAAEAQRSTAARMRSRYDSDARGLLAQGRADNGATAHARRARLGERVLERAERTLAETDAAVTRERGRDIAFAFATDTRAPPRLAFLAAGPLVAGSRVLAQLPALSLARDGRVHIDGDNGAGKTTLLRAWIARGLRVPRERVFFMPQEIDAIEHAQARAAIDALPRDERGRVWQLVAALGADPERVMRSANASPGEQKKLALAFALARGTWALLLDEPTNHLDLPSIERLQAALVAFPGALVLITHDAALARATTTERIRVGAP
jgi:ATPase subunit of ABC transporter with duplicated ATPase domains